MHALPQDLLKRPAAPWRPWLPHSLRLLPIFAADTMVWATARCYYLISNRLVAEAHAAEDGGSPLDVAPAVVQTVAPTYWSTGITRTKVRATVK